MITGVIMRSMALLLGVLLVSVGLVFPNIAEAQKADASVVAKCREKYPDAGTTAERRRNGPMRKQCIQSGGKM
jgi:hypothetical protein